MRSVVALLFLFAIGMSLAGTVQGQIRSESWSADLPPAVALQSESLLSFSLPPEIDLPALSQVAPSYERVLLGTTLGAVLGGAAGLGIVAMTREPQDAVMFPWGDLAAGTVLGSVPGMYLGARLSSGRQGNPWLTAASALGGTALGLVAGYAVGTRLAEGETGKAPEIIGIALGVAIPLGLTSFAEWRSVP